MRWDITSTKIVENCFGVFQKSRGANPFVEEEADLSDEGKASSDETENSDMDQMDNSFINDASQQTQNAQGE